MPALNGVLQDPILAVHGPNGELLGSNDNWGTASNAGEIQGSALAPADNRESAILISLLPANYTAIVRGVNSTTGIALLEVYKLPNPP